jgi:hypothetical protein
VHLPAILHEVDYHCIETRKHPKSSGRRQENPSSGRHSAFAVGVLEAGGPEAKRQNRRPQRFHGGVP